MTEKRFFRVRLAGTCPVKTKIINGTTLTKQWQVKVGAIGDFTKFPDVEAQVVVKSGNGFVPAEDSGGGAAKGSGGGQCSGSAPTPAQDAEGAQTAADRPNFAGMTVEQLKHYLIAKGIDQSAIRGATKTELIERAELIWAKNG